MKPNKLFLIALLSLAFFISACSTLDDLANRVEGSGNLISEDRSVRGFNRISLSGIGKVNITQGERESLTVTTDDNLMEFIETEVRGNTLNLGFRDIGRLKSFNPSDGITFDLTLVNLNRLDISGAGDINIDQLETDKLTIDLSGAGSLEIQDLTADELVTQVSGAGSIVAAGQVTGQEITHSGVGTFHAEDLQSDTAFIKISGAGSCTVWVLENLDVKISGLGNVIYYGNPQVSQQVSGLGKLINQGEK
jgi:hypothetical protein